VTGALDIVSCLFIAGMLGSLGHWGRAHVQNLIPSELPAEEREHREAVLRRGAVAAQVVAAALVGAAVLLAFAP